MQGHPGGSSIGISMVDGSCTSRKLAELNRGKLQF